MWRFLVHGMLLVIHRSILFSWQCCALASRQVEQTLLLLLSLQAEVISPWLALQIAFSCFVFHLKNLAPGVCPTRHGSGSSRPEKPLGSVRRSSCRARTEGRKPSNAMSGPLRSGPSSWRRAASVLLTAGWTHRGPAAPALSPPPAEGFRLLLLQRSQGQGFLPGAYVFPGGILDAADYSADWLSLFAPHHQPPRFSLNPSPPPRSTFPVLPAEGTHAADRALPDDVALRICAIRETFEEAGVLLLRPRASLAAAPEPARALPPPPSLAAWRAQVHRDPRQFLRFCEHLDCTPDIWALHDWSVWLTPFMQRGGRRYNTTFFLCCLSEPPPVYPDLAEVVGCKWSSPSEATESFVSKEIWLAPPQFYEIRRLENFASLSDLHKFCLDLALEEVERWLPISLLTADGRIQLLPGDELYLEDSDFLENVLTTEKRTEEIMKEGKKFHRVVIHSLNHVYSIHVTVQSKNKHVFPKNYVVNKSHL